MASILFDGGPCDNQREHYDDAQLGTGTVSCGGAIYRLHALGAGFYTASVIDPNRSTANPAGVPDAGVTKAWRDFYHGISREVPGQVAASQRSRIRLREQGRR